MKWYLISVLSLFPAFSDAANVRWDFVSAQQSQDGEIKLETIVQPGLNFSVFFSASHYMDHVGLSDFNCNLATMITLVMAESGDVVGGASFGDGMPSLFSTEYTGAAGSAVTADDETFYMGFQVYELLEDYDPETGLYGDIHRGDAYYGWLAFTVSSDNGVVLQTSVINLDGADIVVGAIPEPAAGMLSFLGMALLALRRRARESHGRVWRHGRVAAEPSGGGSPPAGHP